MVEKIAIIQQDVLLKIIKEYNFAISHHLCSQNTNFKYDDIKEIKLYLKEEISFQIIIIFSQQQEEKKKKRKEKMSSILLQLLSNYYYYMR